MGNNGRERMGELGWAPGGGGWGKADLGKLSWGFCRLQTFLLATDWPSVRANLRLLAECRCVGVFPQALKLSPWTLLVM